MTFPPFVDLAAFATSLAKVGRHKGLRQILDQAWRAQSCLGDLQRSKGYCGMLRAMRERDLAEDTVAVLATEGALLSTAVLLYARATSTGGKGSERGSIQLEQGKLTPEQWADHKSLVAVRNEALAHVNPSHATDSHPWHRATFFAVELQPDHWKAASASNQTSFHAATLDRLERMLPVADSLVLGKFRKRMAAVSAGLANSALSRAQLLRFQFDPVQVFGGEKAVAQLLTTSSQETAGFWVNEFAQVAPPGQSQ